MDDFILNYEPWPGNHSRCKVHIYWLGGSALNALAVVVATELLENPGMSVTNAAETIATLLVRRYNVNPHRALWIEHYPDRHPLGMENDPTFDETFDLVTFEWNDGEASHPRWHRVSRRWTDELIEQERKETNEIYTLTQTA